MTGKTIWIINQYASTPETGMGGRHYYLAQELAKLGHKVVVVAASQAHTMHTPPEVVQNFTRQNIGQISYLWVKVPKYTFAHERQRAINWFLFSAKLTRLPSALKHTPDVVLCSSPSLVSYMGAERIARKTGAKLVFEVRDIWPLSLVEVGGFSIKHPFIKLLQWIENRAYRNSDMIISNLRDSYKHMIAHGMELSKFTWIANGYSAEEVATPEPLSEDVLKQIPTGKKIVGYTGSVGAANALHTLVEAAHALRNKTDIHFVIVGKGAFKKQLMENAEQFKLKNLTFIDPIPKTQIQSMLACFDICYIGLRDDPLFRFGVSPNKLFDYMCAGKPIIYAIDSGEYKPVEEFKCGVTIEPENAEQLAGAVEKIASMSDAEVAQMGENGKAAAYEHYEYSALARRLADRIFSDGKEG